MRCRESLRQTLLVIKELRVIDVWAFSMSRRAFGDGAQFLRRSFSAPALEAVIAFPQRFDNGPGYSFTGYLADSLGQAMSFRIFDVEAHAVSTLLQQRPPFFMLGYSTGLYQRPADLLGFVGAVGLERLRQNIPARADQRKSALHPPQIARRRG